MASEVDNLDPVVMLIPDTEPTLQTFNKWLALVAQNEPVNMGISAVGLISEARERDH